MTLMLFLGAWEKMIKKTRTKNLITRFLLVPAMLEEKNLRLTPNAGRK
jgi:hypothetical protein